MTRRGRAGRFLIAFPIADAERTAVGDAVEQTTMSKSARRESRSSKWTMPAPSPVATCAARSCRRPATARSAAPRLLNARAVPSPISPVPRIRTFAAARLPKMFEASSTATLATLTVPEDIPVWVRTCFAAWKAFWKTRFRTAPAVPDACAAAYASFTWPKISFSPRSWESRPLATSKRCRAASRPVSRIRILSNSATSNLWRAQYAAWTESAAERSDATP